MSADNGIYVLHTKDKFKYEGKGLYKNYVDNPVDAYRVAHAQAIENFTRYKENEPYNLGAYMYDIWGKKDVVYKLSKANHIANELEKLYCTEYGISVIDATEYSFYQ